MELSLRSFVKMWPLAVGCILLQTVGGLALTITLGYLFQWPPNLIILLACVFALSSTAVAVKILEGVDELKTNAGKLAIAVLIAQDLAIVPMMLIIRGLSEEEGINVGVILAKVIFSIGFLAGLVWYLSRKERLKLPFFRVVINNQDLTPLMGLTFCFGAAALAGLLGLSAAYGAFLAGLVLGNSNERNIMLEKMTPIYSVLMMVFFLSIGLLMDLQFIGDNFMKMMILMLFITVGKSALNISILHMLKQPWTLSFTAGVVLGQLGEFSFLLAALGTEVGIVDTYASKLIVSLTALSLIFSPLWMTLARRIHDTTLRSNASLTRVCQVIFGHELRALRTLFQKFKRNSDET
jgi:CPA2 family monovalent cation:H+ antiporter-2